MPQRGPLPSKRISFAILKRLTAIVLRWPLASTTAILGALRFEMIFRFAKCDPGPLFEMAHHFGREIAMTIEPGADCGPAEREFLQRGNRLLRAPFPETHLLRVTAEFLAEPHRSRVHQMGATDLDHVLELRRFRRQRSLQVFRARE